MRSRDCSGVPAPPALISCHLRPDITAPVSEGEVMGEMIVTRSAEELARLPLLAAESVERIGFSGIFLKLLGSLAGL